MSIEEGVHDRIPFTDAKNLLIEFEKSTMVIIDGEMKTQKVPKNEVHSRFVKQQKNK